MDYKFSARASLPAKHPVILDIAMKKLILAVLTLTIFGAVAAEAAHHHRHKVCAVRHHHRFCHWR